MRARARGLKEEARGSKRIEEARGRLLERELREEARGRLLGRESSERKLEEGCLRL